MKSIALALAVMTISCTAYAAEKSAGAAENYQPGLGEIMSATQMRHAKIWFAGKAGNWELAHYELDEIREGLADAARFHPLFKSMPVSGMLEQLTTRPLADLDAAVAAQDRAGFGKAYDSLTGACNGCHRATGHGYIVIKRPGASPFSNQAFAPETR